MTLRLCTMDCPSFWDIFEKCHEINSSKSCLISLDDETIHYFTYDDIMKASTLMFESIGGKFEHGETIGVLMKHEATLIASIAMISRSKCAFIFLDSRKKIEEQREILNFLDIRFILTNNTIDTDFLMNIKSIEVPNLKTVSLYSNTLNNFCMKPRHQNISYVIQTTGTTSRPKFVAVTHNSIYPNIIDFQKIFNVMSDDVILFSTPLTFDPVIVEIYLAIMCGASLLHMRPTFTKLNSNLRVHPTIIQTTPSKLFLHDEEYIKNYILGEDSPIKALILGGEPFLYFDKLKKLKHSSNKSKVFNVYGITEVSCWASIEEIIFSADFYDPNIGRSLSGTIIKIEKCDDDDSGFILIGSQTRKCFIDNEIFETGRDDANTNSDTVWRNTGDIGIETDNKTIKFLGRKDSIVKKLGHKVNLKKIEERSLLIESVDQCACIWIADKQKVVLLFTTDSNKTMTKEFVRNELVKYLEMYEMPDEICHINILPLNEHGKLSYSDAINIYAHISEEESEKTDKFYEILHTLLKLNEKSQQKINSSSFIELGGTSIIAIQFLNSLSIENDRFFNLLKMLLNENDSVEYVYEYYKSGPNLKKSKVSNKRDILDSSLPETSKRTKVELKYEMKIEWSCNLGKCIDASPTLFEQSGILYVAIGSHSGKFAVLNAKTGKESFTYECGARIECTALAFDNELNNKCLCFGDYNGTVWCILVCNLSILWKKHLGFKVKSKPCYYDSILYVGSYDSHLYSICSKTGSILNKVKIGNSGISADLLLSTSRCVFVGTLDGTVACIEHKTLTVKWEKIFPSPIFANLILDQSRKNVIVTEVKGILHSVDIITGREIWKFDNIEGLIFSTPLICEIEQHQCICFGCHNNNYYILQDRGLSEPTVRNKVNLNCKIYADPCEILETDTVCVTTDGDVTIIDMKTATVAGRVSLPGEAFSSPKTVGDRLYVGCRDDHIYCIKICKLDE